MLHIKHNSMANVLSSTLLSSFIQGCMVCVCRLYVVVCVVCVWCVHACVHVCIVCACVCVLSMCVCVCVNLDILKHTVHSRSILD